MADKDISSKNLTTYESRNLPHWQIGGSWYFITFRTDKGSLHELAREIVKETIVRSHKLHYSLAVAVAMPDHVHLLIRPLTAPSGCYFPLSKIMKTLKGVAARKINKHDGVSKTIWQKESFDRIIRSEKEWLEKYDYIRNNAVKAGLVERPEDYPWLMEQDGLEKGY
ncbi:MAG: transposase [Nitrospinae bacterium]|nr:transposase [Nitrospinota bacterium]